MESIKIQELIEKIQQEACLSEEETFPNLEEYLSDIIEVYISLTGVIPEYKKQGIEIPEGIILQQVKNLQEAVEHKDLIKLYDTLKYEVLDTFKLYQEILMEMGQ